MERLMLRYHAAKNALGKLETVLQMSVNDVVRDAAIQRFEFTLEATWKFAQHYLSDEEGVEVGSPKATVRACLQQLLLTEQETHVILQMIDDRNLTVHTYNEPLATLIFNKLPDYFMVLKAWLQAMEERVNRD